MGSIATLTFFRFNTISQKSWALAQMLFAHTYLREIQGLKFYKLMGSGTKLGFSPLPDWSVYALLGLWESEQAANSFFQHANIIYRFKLNSIEQWNIFMRIRHAKGLWSGGNPFTPSTDLDEANPLIAVITRATIRPGKLLEFWRYVPTSERPIQNGFEGLIYSKGIGEVPLSQMATFSIWENIEALKRFAYNSHEHQVAIQKTRELEWYKEEMFVRFQPYRSDGMWHGKNTLADYLKP